MKLSGHVTPQTLCFSRDFSKGLLCIPAVQAGNQGTDQQLTGVLAMSLGAGHQASLSPQAGAAESQLCPVPFWVLTARPFPELLVCWLTRGNTVGLCPPSPAML